jgi:hypothetical protein
LGLAEQVGGGGLCGGQEAAGSLPRRPGRCRCVQCAGGGIEKPSRDGTVAPVLSLIANFSVSIRAFSC